MPIKAPPPRHAQTDIVIPNTSANTTAPLHNPHRFTPQPTPLIPSIFFFSIHSGAWDWFVSILFCAQRALSHAKR